MATSSVSALDQDTYQLIQTNTTTSGTTSTFSGLSGYKKYIIAWEGVTQSTNGNALMQFNSSSTNYFGGVVLQYNIGQRTISTGIKLTWDDKRTSVYGNIVIENINNNAPKSVTGLFFESGAPNDYITYVDGGWLTVDPITSIVITAGGAGTFSAGSMKLYGIAG